MPETNPNQEIIIVNPDTQAIDEVPKASSIQGATLFGFDDQDLPRKFDVNDIKGDFKGIADPTVDYGVPILERWWKVNVDTLYPYLGNIIIPRMIEGKYVTAPTIVWDGDEYIPDYSLQDKPDLSADFATKESIDPLLEAIKSIDSPDKFFIVDSAGNIIFQADKDEVDYFGKVTQAQITTLTNLISALSANPLFSKVLDLYPNEFIVSDPEGNIIFRSGLNLTDFVGKNTGGAGAIIYREGTFDSDLLQGISYGQSLASTGTAVAAIDFYDTKTFTGGVLTNYDPADVTAKNTYYGSSLIDVPQNGVDICKAMIKIVKELVASENGIPIVMTTDPVTGLKYDSSQQFQFVINAPGAGGLSYAQISDINGIYYKRFIDSVKFSNDYSISKGRTFSVSFVGYFQGENTGDQNSTVLQWYNNLDALFANLNQDIKGITGQKLDVQFINYQISSFNTPPFKPNVGLAVLKLCVDRANVHFGTAMYMNEYGDALHWTSLSARVSQARMGVVAKRAIVDKVKMKPILPISWTIEKNTASTLWVINMKMQVEVKPLVFDLTVNSRVINGLAVVAPANYGFSILNASGAEIITKVTISRGNTLNISCSEDPLSWELTYAIKGNASGGNLRDSQGDKITISFEGVNKRVDNWAPFFKQVITA